MKTTLALLSFVLITGFASAQIAVQQASATTGDNTTYTYELISDPAVLGLPNDNNKMSNDQMVNNITVKLKAIKGVSEVNFNQDTQKFTVLANNTAVMPDNVDAVAKDLVEHPE